MQTKKMIFILSVFSLNAFGQMMGSSVQPPSNRGPVLVNPQTTPSVNNQRPAYIPPSPSLEAQEEAKCHEFVAGVNNKFNLDQNPSSYCNNETTRKKILKTPEDFSTCVHTIMVSTNYRYNPLQVCLSDNIRKTVFTKPYQDCIRGINTYELGVDQFRLCLDPETVVALSEPAFPACFKAYKQAYPYQLNTITFNICKDDKKAENAAGPSFLKCHAALRKLGADVVTSASFCLDGKNQQEDHLSDLTNCTKSFDEMLSRPGISYCIELNNSLKTLTANVMNCVSDLKTSFLDKTYFSDEGFTTSSKTLKGFVSQCQKQPTVKPELNYVEFSSLKVLSTNKRIENTILGGLSGLAFDKKTNTMLIVSDDPGIRSDSRIYNLINFSTANQLEFKGLTPINSIVEPKKPSPVVAKDPKDPKDPKDSKKEDEDEEEERYPRYYNNYNTPYTSKYQNIDAEGIALLPTNELVISSETLLKDSKSYIRLYSREGTQKAEIPLPEKFSPLVEDVEVEETFEVWVQDRNQGGFFNGNNNNNWPTGHYETRTRKEKKRMQTMGVQANKAFEALTSVPGKSILFTANEYPLIQDDMEDKKIVRITRLVRDANNNFVSDAEFAYPLDKTESNGLVELVAIDSNRILTLERRFDAQKQAVTAQIFEIDISQARNYSDVDSFKKEHKLNKIETVSKKLILNLDDIMKYLPAGIRKIDNFEGMALGPKLANGKQSLVMVTDNNFSAGQLTQLLILELNQ